MKLKFFRLLFTLLVVSAALLGCKKEYISINELDEQNIQAYLKQNNLNMQPYDTTGIYYQVIREGSGPAINYEAKIPLLYTVKSLDGQYTAQDTFVNRYAGFFGYFYPAGLRDAVKDLLKNRGGKIRVIVPSRRAYGRNGSGPIPGNASLDYEVTVLDESKLDQYEDYTIQQYLQKNNLSGFSRSSSGLYYKILAEGTGSPIGIDSTITVKYSGKLLNGEAFDSSDSYSFKLSGLIPAWKEAVPLIKEGGEIQLITPSKLGYGVAGSGITIPPFSVLDFNIKVNSVASQ